MLSLEMPNFTDEDQRSFLKVHITRGVSVSQVTQQLAGCVVMRHSSSEQSENGQIDSKSTS